MNEAVRIIAFVCAVIVLAVAIFALTACATGGIGYQTETYEITENIENLSIKVDTSDVEIRKSEDGVLKVVCNERKKERHTVKADMGTLEVNSVDDRKWYEKVSLFGYRTMKVTVYLPEEEYAILNVERSTGDLDISAGFIFGDTDIRCSTGDTKIIGSSFGALSVRASTGDITLTEASCTSLTTECSTGCITLSEVSCAGDAKITASTGDVAVSDLTAATLESMSETGEFEAERVTLSGGLAITTDTGKVSISELSAGDSSVKTDTGRVRISRAELASFTSDTDTGDVELESVVASGSYNIKADTGDIRFDGCDAAEIYVKTSSGSVKGSFLTPKVIFAETGSGGIDVPKLTEGGRCEIKTGSGGIKITIGE